MGKKCDAPVEVYCRVCGFFRPVKQFNKGKKEEFFERVNFKFTENIKNESKEDKELL